MTRIPSDDELRKGMFGAEYRRLCDDFARYGRVPPSLEGVREEAVRSGRDLRTVMVEMRARLTTRI